MKAILYEDESSDAMRLQGAEEECDRSECACSDQKWKW